MAVDPTYVTVARTLREAIERGEYAPGDQLPPYVDLARRHGVSQQTVIEAVRLLVQEGLVRTKRGRWGGGLYVADPTVVRFPFSLYSLLSRSGSSHGGPWQTACAEQGASGDMKVLAAVHEPADPGVARELQRDEGSIVVRRRRHALLNGYPVQIQDAIYPWDIAEGTPLASPGRVEGGVLPLLTSLPTIPQPIRIATLRITTRATTPEESKVLGLSSRGEPVAEIRRIVVDADGRPIELLRIVATRQVEFVVDVPPTL